MIDQKVADLIHPMGVLAPHNKGSSYPHQVRFGRRLCQGATVSGLLHRIPHVQYIDWVREWLLSDDEGMYVGAQ